VAVDLSAPSVALPARTRAGTLAFPTWAALGALVCLSALVRFLLALGHVTPSLWPDEYIYSSLAESLAESGRPLVRGAHAHFPALLEPLLAAPTWLFGDPELVFRLTQGLHALAMSLATIPVYLLTRRLGLSELYALGAATIAVASPDLAFASFVLADPIAYPLVLGAVCAGVFALAEPRHGNQLAFVALSGLAAFARVQYVVLPLAFLAAAFVIERGHVPRVLTRFKLSFGLFAAPLVVALALGPTRVLGYYSGVTKLAVDPGHVLRWMWTDAVLLAYPAGWILVPGACLGLALALFQPQTRAESAFATLTTLVGGGLLVEAAVYAANGTPRFQERYLFSLLAFVAPAYGLFVRRGPRALLLLVLLAVGMAGIASRMPLSGYFVVGRDASPSLLAIHRLSIEIGDANASLAVALAVTALSCLAVLCAWRPRRGTAIAIALSILAATALSAGAFAADVRNSQTIRDRYLPDDLSWVDHSRLGPVALLQLPNSSRALALDQLFWNRSVDDVLTLEGGSPVDAFGSTAARIARDGRLLAGGKQVLKPVLIQTWGSLVVFGHAPLVARGPSFQLRRTGPRTRIVLLIAGRYENDWLAGYGKFTVWPVSGSSARRRIVFTVSLPRGFSATALRLSLGNTHQTIRLAPGESRTLSFAIPQARVWNLGFQALTRPHLLGDGRFVSVKASLPRFEYVGLGA
jgi:hypothetical protein